MYNNYAKLIHTFLYKLQHKYTVITSYCVSTNYIYSNSVIIMMIFIILHFYVFIFYVNFNIRYYRSYLKKKHLCNNNMYNNN